MPDELMNLWRSARGCCLAIVALALLLLLGACVALGWGVARWTEAAGEPGLDVLLVIDQSGSLWELGGVGTDPELLRMEGARLFAAALGVDGAAASYRLGAIYFGSRPTLLAPLTPLTGQAGQRAALLTALAADPQPMGWTDVNAALALAYDELFLSPRAQDDTAKAVVLFTDGRPQSETLDNPAALATYIDALRAQIQAFTVEGAAVHTVLLANTASDADPLTAELYRPLWVGLAQQNSNIQFYEARASQDLTLIYHDIVTQLQRKESQGLVLRDVVSDELVALATVLDGWQSATFVVTKSRSDLQVTLAQPDGETVRADAAGVRHTSQLDGRYETWSIDRPIAGEWRVEVTGQGAVAVWLDYQPLPATPTVTASPTATRTPTATASPTASPTATATPSPTASPTATANPTLTPLAVDGPYLEIMAPDAQRRSSAGEPEAVLIAVRSAQPYTVGAWVIGPNLETAQVVTLARQEGARGEATTWRGETAPLGVAGAYTVTARLTSAVGRGVHMAQERQVTFTVVHRRAAWPWLAGAGLVAGLGVAGGVRRWQRGQPQVEGVLRLVQGPAGQPAGVSWDLSQRQRRTITVGSNKRCDVALLHEPGLPAQAAIIAAGRANGPQFSAVSASQEVRINGKSVAGTAALRDGDRIEIGSYHLRYENLALRCRSPQGSPGSQASELELVWPE